jgi:phosphoribosylanthranilate isomerase
MFRIKICGITTIEDAQAVVQAGADAIGLNFYSESPRVIDLDTARAIISHLPPEIVKVGLFVDSTLSEVCDTFDELGLDAIQLHGDEPATFLAKLGERPVIRAFRVAEGRLHRMTDYLAACHQLGSTPRMALADAQVPGVYGGTGSLADWKTLRAYPTQDWHPPLILAGGLTPQNVGDAISLVRPAAVDTASGVESSPRRKDAAKVGAFVRAASAAFNLLE